MSVPPFPCPNCGTPTPPDVTVCPHCGYLRPAAPTWPPPPGGVGAMAPPPPPVPKLVTGKAWGDLTLGIGISIASDFFYGLGLIVMPFLYFMLKPNYPALARGIGYGFLASLVLLLGAVGVCFYALSNYHGG